MLKIDNIYNCAIEYRCEKVIWSSVHGHGHGQYTLSDLCVQCVPNVLLYPTVLMISTTYTGKLSRSLIQSVSCAQEL